MLNSVIAKVFGTSNERAVKRLLPTVTQINSLEPAMQALSDEELRNKTVEFRKRIADAIAGIEDTPKNADERYAAEKAALDEILPEAFAVVREAGRRNSADAPLRRAADRWHGVALRQDLRDERPAKAKRWSLPFPAT